MAVGDMVKIHSSVASGASLSIQPGSGIEWILQNFYMGSAWELYRTNGTHPILIENGNLSDALTNRNMIATNTIYFSLKNVSNGSAYFGYDGLVIK